MLGGVSDIRHHGCIETGAAGWLDQPRRERRQAFNAGDVAGDVVHVDADQINKHLLGVFLSASSKTSGFLSASGFTTQAL